jgi:hypothetical protein
MLAPISLAKRLILLKQFVLTLLLEILNRSRHRQLGQHMHVVSIDRARVNRHFVRPRNLTQKLPRALSNVPTQNRIAVFRHPNQVILASTSTPSVPATSSMTPRAMMGGCLSAPALRQARLPRCSSLEKPLKIRPL